MSALRKLTSVDGAKFIIGPTWETFVSTMPICESNKIICFAPSNHGNSFHDSKKPLKYSFTAFFDERGYATTLADRMISDGRKQVAVFSTISAYFETLLEAFRTSFNIAPSFIEKFDPDLKDFRTLILKTPKDIDSLFLILDGTGQNYLFLTQWKQLRRDTPIIYSHDGILYEPNWDKIKQMGFKIEVSKPFLAPELEKAWAVKFKERFNREPAAPTGAVSYDETMMTLQCIKDVGRDVEKVRGCISKTANYDGLSGKISFNGGQAVTNRTYTTERFSGN